MTNSGCHIHFSNKKVTPELYGEMIWLWRHFAATQAALNLATFTSAQPPIPSSSTVNWISSRSTAQKGWSSTRSLLSASAALCSASWALLLASLSALQRSCIILWASCISSAAALALSSAAVALSSAAVALWLRVVTLAWRFLSLSCDACRSTLRTPCSVLVTSGGYCGGYCVS